MSYRASLMIKHTGKCFYCDANLSFAEATTDHFVPRSRGGKNSKANRVLACQPCNHAKANLDPRHFGIRHPDDPTPEARHGMLVLRARIISKQLSRLRERRTIP